MDLRGSSLVSLGTCPYIKLGQNHCHPQLYNSLFIYTIIIHYNLSHQVILLYFLCWYVAIITTVVTIWGNLTQEKPSLGETHPSGTPKPEMLLGYGNTPSKKNNCSEKTKLELLLGHHSWSVLCEVLIKAAMK